METRIYAINLDKISDEINHYDLSDNEFISESEEQGLVWSLNGFESAFNNEEISDQWVIRIITL